MMLMIFEDYELSELLSTIAVEEEEINGAINCNLNNMIMYMIIMQCIQMQLSRVTRVRLRCSSHHVV